MASPALERQHFVEVALRDLRGFRETTESTGLLKNVNTILAGGTVTMTSEEIEALAGQFERLPEVRRITADRQDNHEGLERERRFERVQTGDNNNSYVIRYPKNPSKEKLIFRHNVDSDIATLVNNVNAEIRLLQPFFNLYSQILTIERNFPSLETSAEARLLVVFNEQVQRAMHRLSHAMHHLSDFNVDLLEERPRRAHPHLPDTLRLQPISEVFSL